MRAKLAERESEISSEEARLVPRRGKSAKRRAKLAQRESKISSEEDEALGRRSRRRRQAPTCLDPSAAQVAPRRHRTRTSITTRWGGTIE